MTKKNIDTNWFVSGFQVFFKSLHLYLSNFEKFIKYISFPVLGQLLGIFLIFLINYIFILNIPNIAQKSTIFNNITIVFTLLVICLMPGFLIFTKAFFDYLLAMSSLNLAANNLLTDEEMNDINIHKDIVKQRIVAYIFLLLILSILYTILSFPLFWVILIPAMILYSLSIQAFTLEDKKPFESMGLSYILVKYNLGKTLIVLILTFLLTYIILPELIFWSIKKADLAMYLSNPIELYINLLPLNDINMILTNLPIINIKLTSSMISMSVIKMIITFCTIGYTLPLRCIACTSLFKEFYGNNITDDDDTRKLLKKAK